MRLQGSLGKVEKFNRKDMNMGGYLTLGRVIEVHNKYSTADVMLVNTKDTLMGSKSNQGRFSCKIATNNAHYDADTNTSWGVMEPVCVDDLVLVAFLDNLKSHPIIINSFHRMDRTDNILPDEYPIYGAEDSLKFLRVFPSQNYIRVSGNGDTEVTFVGKSFISIGDSVSDAHNSTDFEDLSEKSNDGKTKHLTKSRHEPTDLSARVFRSSPTSKKFLFVFRDNMDDSETTWTKLFFDSGLLRLTRDNNDGKLSYIELNKSGNIKIRRQLDSDSINGGQHYTEIGVSADGMGSIKNKNGSDSIEVLINPDSTISIKKDNDLLLSIDSNKHLTIEVPYFSVVCKDNPDSYIRVTSQGVDIGNP